MHAVVKLEAIVTLFCDGCYAKDTMIRLVSISENSVDVLDLPEGWKKNYVFTVKTEENAYCPKCVAKALSEDDWIVYQDPEYIGHPDDEGRWFDLDFRGQVP